MSGEARISEREAVMRERAAFIVGACDTLFATRDGARDDAERRYPLPKVERPRVVRDPHSGFTQTWRVVDETVQWRDPDFNTEWKDLDPFAYRSDRPSDIRQITPHRIALWASLLASPTELVDEPDPGVSS